jgi:ADP-heptose:LPS heptosyltransferase
MAFPLANLIVLDRYVGGIVLLVLKPIVILAGRIMRRDHALEPQGDILIIKLLGAGSLFMALPNLLGLRRRFPDRKIHLLTTPVVAKFARSFNVFDTIYLIDHGSGIRLAGSALRALYRLRSIDTVIDLEAYSRAATLIALFLCARNRLAFFIDEVFWKRHIATHLVFLSRNAAVYEFYDQVFALLGVMPAAAADVRSYLLPGSAAITQEPRQRPHICIGHASSELAGERELTAAGWAHVLSAEFPQTGSYTFEILGGEEDVASGEKVAGALRAAFPRAIVLNSCKNDVPAELFAVIDGADEFWGVDSLNLHIARSLRKPTHSFWGPTAPQCLRDLDPSRDRVHYEKIICSPCTHLYLRPPCRGDNLCMQRLCGVPGSRERKPQWVIS